MKKYFYFYMAAFISAGAMFTACSSDNFGDNSNDITDPNYNAQKFFDEQKNDLKQTLTLTTADYGKTITLNGGTKITIPTCGFTVNGVAISGSFTLEAQEMLDVSDMILSGTNTNYASQKRYFESDGYVNIDVKKDGKSVDQTMGCNMNVSIPTDKADWAQTQIWTGNPNADGAFTWEEPADTAGVVGFEGQADGGVKGNMTFSFSGEFKFGFTNLGWYNCDVLWGTGARTTVTVSLTGYVGTLAPYSSNASETYVAFVVDSTPVVAQLYTKVNDTTVKSYDNSMPVGMKGTLIAFTVKNGKVAFASKHITVTENMNETLDLKEVTKQALIDAIKKLDVKKG